LGLIFFLIVTASAQEKVDGIVAIVDEEIITLTDFRIAWTFGLFYRDVETGTSPAPRDVLENLIDQKLILQMTNPDLSLPAAEIEAEFLRLRQEYGEDYVRRHMDDFDIDRDALFDYIRRLLAFRHVLDERFQLSINLSLQEIETYYSQVYVPDQRAEGLDPRPMVEILPELERALKSRRTRALIREWQRNLRKEADIQVYADKYPEYFGR
jgi:hypothetical protein